MADRPAVLLVLAPVADPLARRGRPPREPVARLRGVLRGLLRGAGWRVRELRVVKPALWFTGDGDGV